MQHLTDDSEAQARTVFAGLTPNRQVAIDEQPRFNRHLTSTMPIILVGTLTATLSVTTTVEPAAAKPALTPKASTNGGALAAAKAAVVAALPAPSSYTVVSGDTISKIAARYGLSTASILALNGLSASSLIFPGQKLTLLASAPAAAPTTAAITYTIVSGDTVSRIAARFGVTTASVLAANGLTASSVIYPGQKLVIPGAASTSFLPVDLVVAVRPVAVYAGAQTPPATSAPAPAPAPVVPANGTYVIQSGDNLTKIAAKFGVSVQAILAANGLTATSIIYAGRTLVIPGIAITPAGTGTLTLLADDQAANAITIIGVGRSLGVSDYGIIIALSAAMQESSLRNINYGHLDSVGLFQQRPSSGWGTVAQLTDATYAARLFFGGPSNPNKGRTRGLLDIAGWQSMTVTQAAQKVQVSAYPDAYAKWEASARLWLSELG